MKQVKSDEQLNELQHRAKIAILRRAGWNCFYNISHNRRKLILYCFKDLFRHMCSRFPLSIHVKRLCQANLVAIKCTLQDLKRKFRAFDNSETWRSKLNKIGNKFEFWIQYRKRIREASHIYLFDDATHQYTRIVSSPTGYLWPCWRQISRLWAKVALLLSDCGKFWKSEGYTKVQCSNPKQ